MPFFFSQSLFLLLLFFKLFLITLIFFGILFASFFIFILLLSLLFRCQLFRQYFSLFDLELKSFDSVGEKPWIGLIGGFPLFRHAVDAIDLKSQLQIGVRIGDVTHIV